MTYTIGVSGSVTWTDQTRLDEVLTQQVARARAEGADHILVVHGGAPGADTLTEAYCRRHGIPTGVYPADWKRYGRRAGFKRNSEMVADNADARVWLAFLMPCARAGCDRPEAHGSHGTEHCAELAEHVGITVVRIPHDDEPSVAITVPPEERPLRFGVFVSTPTFTALLLFDQQGGTCIEAPPYLARYVGWTAAAIAGDLQQRYGHKLIACSVPTAARALPVRDQAPGGYRARNREGA